MKHVVFSSGSRLFSPPSLPIRSTTPTETISRSRGNLIRPRQRHCRTPITDLVQREGAPAAGAPSRRYSVAVSGSGGLEC